MATITPSSASANGLITYQSATASDTLTIGTAQRCVLHVNNTSGSSITATLAGTNACNFGSTHNAVITCAVGVTTIEISGLLYQQVVSATGNVTITYSSTTSITVGAITT